MKRLFVGMLTALLALGLVATDVDAQKKKKRRKARDKTPTSAVIAKSMGDLKWGMSKDDVIQMFVGKVKKKYRPLVAKTHDAVEEDRLRQEAKAEMRRIRDGYVEFEGRSTGWDVSFLKGEFTHNNGESMLVIRDKNSQNFYFFIGGRLWKWYKAFDASEFPANNFKAFAGAVQRRFGKAKDTTGELRPGAGKRHWLEWQDKKTRLRAVDQTDFYGFYCLVFEEKDTVGKLAKLRSSDSGSGKKSHALVDSVTSERGYDDPDDSPNIVDRITGKIRAREQAPEARSSKRGKKRRSRGSDSDSSSSGVSSDDDPLSGRGL
ncbi:MAG: hypothetical protein OXT09_19095 [Myxococcales bacterium]|nr:hypothetical protein [Myxococcales bacterium]